LLVQDYQHKWLYNFN